MLIQPARSAQGPRPTGPVILNRASPQSRGLVAWLPMTQGSGVQEMVGLIGTPRRVNGLGLSGDPRHGGFPTFNPASDQHITLGDPKALQFTGHMSISCWYRLNSLPELDNQYMLVAKDTDVGGRAFTFDVGRLAGDRFYISGGGAGYNLSFDDIPPVVGEVRHVVGTYDPVYGLGIYTNGDLNNLVLADAAIPSSTSNVLIGRREYAGYTNPFDGAIWDVRIYNRTLWPAEVDQLYDPQTRWDLYWQPSNRVYFDGSEAPPGEPGESTTLENYSLGTASAFAHSSTHLTLGGV